MKKSHDSDVAFIRSLAELLRETDLTELEVSRDYGEDDGLNVRLARQPGIPSTPSFDPAPPPRVVPPPPLRPEVAAEIAPASTDDPAQDPGAVTSPMVGTIYLASEPGAAEFVKVGDTVTEGDTLLIVEAMKTMNQIPSPRAGTVKRILVEDGAPVEYGAPLVILS